MLLSIDDYKGCFYEQGMQFYTRDCAVRNKNVFNFATEPVMDSEQEEEYGDLPPQGVITFSRDGNQWGASFLYGFEPVVLGASFKPTGHSVSIEPYDADLELDERTGLRVFIAGSGQVFLDEPLATFDEQSGGESGAFERGGISKLKIIDGWLYACGGNRGFGKRLGKGKWQSFTQFFPFDKNAPVEGYGFEDFDAFNEQDIYLVGGRGDVWQFDGKKARQIPIPTNVNLETVCCGDDGEVYISGAKGMTFHRRGDRWERVENEEPYEDSSNLPFRDMVWHEDKVWATNDDGLWVIENNVIKEADIPDWVRDCYGSLSTGDGVLLLAGEAGAVFRENGEWHKILLFGEMEALLKAEKGR